MRAIIEEMAADKHPRSGLCFSRHLLGMIEMDCRESQQLISAYYDGELLGEQRTELEVHFERCPSCLMKLGEIRQLSRATRNLPSPQPPPELWDRIAASLDDEQPRQPTDVVLSRPSSDALP